MRPVVATAAALMLTLLAGCAAESPVPPGPTDAEVDGEVSRQLDGYWEALSLPDDVAKPDAATIEYSDRDSWSSDQVSCLQGHGLPAREVSGGFSIDSDGAYTPTESIVIQWTCLREFPVDPRTLGFLSVAQVHYMYDYFVNRLAPCLELNGFVVPEPPDRDAYVGTVREGTPWNPYYDAEGVPIVSGAGELAALDRRCPPLPSDPYGAYRPFETPAAG